MVPDNRAAVIAVGLLAALAIPDVALAFTQSGVGTSMGNGIPMGHEWLTRLSALELLGNDPIMAPDPVDPRLLWTEGTAKNLDISAAGAQQEVSRIFAQPYSDQRYESTYKPIYDAIMGARWVDIGGFNVTTSTIGTYDCHNAVMQDPAEAQYDHFLRRYDDNNGDGGLQAAVGAIDRFIEYFVAAAMAPPTLMRIWDGGGYSAQTDVDRNYFLFGRAIHLFQDSFSSEHTVRIVGNNVEHLRQVKSYLCTPGSEQHTHSYSGLVDYTSGDVIWEPGTQFDVGWSGYKPSNMKDLALVATEATKDLWAAFIRTMGVPIAQREAIAVQEATLLASNWLSFDDAELLSWYDNDANRGGSYVFASGQSGKGQAVSTCTQDLGYNDQASAVLDIENTQRICLYNVTAENGYSDLFDTSIHMPYNWKWKSYNWLQPPAGWVIPDRPADTGIRVKIKNVSNGQYMVAPAGVANNSWIYCKPGSDPLEFILVGTPGNAVYRLASANLFLSYHSITGAVKLYSTPAQAEYQLVPAGPGYAIKNLFWNQYMWLSGQSPYITSSGKSYKSNAQWYIEGLP